ncbi:hypothetical protein [Parasphingopyxis sp.]|uniref:hypothetical protein n=1 Tax=Parasphingopyxis sp. TaxID=1920299 RepID=UPI0026250DF2|nr:hypothetical protein [Parasphingopyxis sp.]
MNKNIIIIIGAAVAAFLAVLLIPRLLDSGEDEAPATAESSDNGGDSGSTGSAGSASSSGDDKDDPAQSARSARGSNPVLEAQLAEAVRQVNAGGPVVIDEFTTMTSARAQGNRILYRYEISRNLNATQVSQFQQYASNQNQQTICRRPETRQLIDIGGEIEYVYFGPGNRFLFSTAITSC